MKRKNARKSARTNVVIEPLSPRVLYSVDVFGFGGDIGLPEEQAHELTPLANFGIASDGGPKQRFEAVFVDTSVSDYRDILDSLRQSSDQNTEYLIYAIKSDQSVSSVSDALASHNNLDAIHFITHGSDADFRLGDSVINNDTVGQHSDNFSQWGESLTADGDILFYGCNLAETAQGKQLVDKIAQVTGADVGASDNRTGHESLDADWKLEYATGPIEVDESRLATILNDWESKLQTIVVTTLADIEDPVDSVISLREAINAANSVAGEDTIILQSGTYVLDGTNALDMPLGELEIRDDVTIVGAGTEHTAPGSGVTIASLGNGTVISGNDTHRVFDVAGDFSLTLEELVVANGNNTIDSGGGIHITNPNAELVLEDVKLINNKAAQGGGAIHSAAPVYLREVEISYNQSLLFGGGIYQSGQTIHASDTVIKNNKAMGPPGQGGGVFTQRGQFIAQDTEIKGNEALSGGGIYIGSSGEFNATDTSFTDNKATRTANNGNGGAINNNGTVTIDRSLINSNEAQFGGGVSNRGTITISDTTISKNEAIAGSSAVGGVAGSITFINRSTIVDNKGNTNLATLGTSSSGVQQFEVTGSIIARNGEDHPFNVENVKSTGFNLFDKDIETQPYRLASDHVASTAQLDTWLSQTANSDGHYELYFTTDNLALNNGAATGANINPTLLDATGAARNVTADIGAYEYRDGTVVNDGPSVLTNELLVMETNTIQLIDSSVLSAIDPDQPKNEIVYNVTAPAANVGELRVNNNPQTSPTVTFTQEDIESGDVSFESFNGGTHKLDFYVDDGTYQTTLREFSIFSNKAPALVTTDKFLLNDSSANNNPGTSVGDILDSLSPDRFTDVDTDDEEGIAIVWVDDANGTWEYKIAPTAPWQTVSPVTENNALLLTTNSILRFAPDTGYNGPAEVGFRAHDWTTNETPGPNYNIFPGLSLTGGSNPNSNETGIILSPAKNIQLNTLNFENSVPTQIVLHEDTIMHPITPAISIDDPEGDNYDLRTRLELTGNGTLSTNGILSIDASIITIANGANGTDLLELVGTINEINTALQTLTYTPNPNFHGSEELIITTSADSTPILSGTEGQYSFDSVTVINESTGSAPNGELSAGAQIVTDSTRGNVLSVANGEHVEIDSNFNISDAFTISAWVNIADVDANSRGEIVSIDDHFILSLDNRAQPNTGVVGHYKIGGTEWERAATFIDINNEGWTHLVYTVDTSANTQALYIDGVQRATVTTSDKDILPGAQNITNIGKKPGNNSSFSLSGLVDDVKILSRSVTTDEVTALFLEVTEDIDTIPITVKPVNDPPSSANTSIQTNEDTLYRFNASDFSFSDVSVPGDDHGLANVIVDRLPSEGQLLYNSLAVTAGQPISKADIDNGALEYAPPANQHGVSIDSWDFRVQDNGGTTNGGLDTSQSSNTIFVDITSINDAPAGTDNLIALTEDDPYQFQSTDFGFTDIEADNFAQLEIVTLPLPASGTLSLQGAPVSVGQLINAGMLSNLEYTPTPTSQGASVSWDFVVRDTGGTVNGGMDTDQSPNTITFDHQFVNDPPQTTPVTLNPIAEDSGIRVITQTELLANATDIEGDSLSANGLVITSGNGTLADNNDGTWSYTPATNDNGTVNLAYTIADSINNVAGTAALIITPVNDAPQTTPVTLTPIAEDSGVRLITQTELLANATDIEGDVLSANGLTITSGNGTLADNNDGTWSYTPATNDNGTVTLAYTVTDSVNSVAGTAALSITPVNDAPQTTPVTLTPIVEDSGVRLITQNELLANATDIEGDVLSANGLTIVSGNGTLVDNNDGTWSYTPATNDNGTVTLAYTVTDNINNVAGTAALIITPVNDAPQTTPATLTQIAEDSGVRVITQTELLANATDIEGDTLSANGLVITSGNGTLADNNDGTWSYTPANNDNGTISFAYTVTDNINNVAGTAALIITPVNDAPQTAPVTLTPIAEDSGVRLITQTELLANATDIEGDALSANGLTIVSGNGTLVDNNDGTWSYTPASNNNGTVSFAYTVTDNINNVAATAALSITPANDAPQTAPVTLTPIAEDSGIRVITQTELLANATDIEGDILSATGLTITSGNGTLADNNDGTWSYTPANNDNGTVSFAYTVTDSINNVAGTAALIITPVNDAPQTTPVTLTSIAEDSGVRLITQNELLANATDIEGDALSANGLVITSGNGTLADNNDGTWSYTPANNDNGTISFAYTVTDNINNVAGTAALIITPVNDAPQTAPVILTPIAEDSSVRVITQTELLANATDIEGDALSATGLVITSGNGTLVDNNDGTWSYTPANNDNGTVSFAYTVTDSINNVAGTAALSITPVNDAPQTTPVTLTPIAEDSGVRVITQTELLANATDLEGDALSANGLTITSGNGTLVDNNDGTWSYTPANNDNGTVSFAYTVADSINNVAGTAALSITPVNDAPQTTPVTLTPIAEDSGVRVITQTELLANATDVEGDTLSATGLVVTSGNGTLVNNNDDTWSYTPANNDNGTVSFAYTVTDSINNVAGTAALSITPDNDAPQTTPVTLTPIVEDSGVRVITQTELLANATDLEGDALSATGLIITSGNGSLVDNNDGTWSYTPATNDNDTVSFAYTVTDSINNVASTAALSITPDNDAPQTTQVTLTPITEDGGVRVITQTELLANSTDFEGDALSATGLAITSGNGTLADNNDGTWSYTPATNDNGVISLSYTITDGANTVASVATLNITPVNDAPTSTPGILAPAVEDSNRLITQAELLANVEDIDSASLTASNLQASTGTLTDNGDGSWSFTPAANDDSNLSVTYTVSDGTSNVTVSATMDITPVNDAPEDLTITGNLQVPENTEVSNIGSVVFTDADLDDNHQITVNDDRFEVINGVLALKPDVIIDFEAEDVIPLQLSVTDTAGATVLQDFIIQVTDVNEAPVVNQELESQSGTGAFSFAVPANIFFDVDGDPLALSATLADGSPMPEWVQFDPATGEFIVSENGSGGNTTGISILLTATDPNGLDTSTIFDLTVEPPIVAALPAIPQVIDITPVEVTPVAIEPAVDNDDIEIPAANEEASETPTENTLRSDEPVFEAAQPASEIDIDAGQQNFNRVVQLETDNSAQTITLERLNTADISVKNHKEFQLQTAQDIESKVTRTQQEIDSINTVALNYLSQQADASQSKLDESQAITTTVLATSTTLTSSLSVGYILWLLRGGTLVASMMASLPAWRTIDPLPILESITGDNENDNETLESMVETDNEDTKEIDSRSK